MNAINKVTVIGAGLAGAEAAMQLANNNIYVDLYEMKPQKYTPAHSYSGFAELVCSNSLKSARFDSAAGILKEEMRKLGSVVMESAEITKVPAGGALAVDREKFSDYITEKINSHPYINVISEEITLIPDGYVVIASGPLTSDALANSIKALVNEEHLSFFDAAAPIIDAQCIDRGIVFAASRYNKGIEENPDEGNDDYLNCPMNKEEYEIFYNELINAQSAKLKEFENKEFKVYEGCMPVEVLAKRGEGTLRFGPLKPVGLTDPRTDRRPWAVVQLRKENVEATMYNLVGFQTNLTWSEQKRVFSFIPGLKDIDILRYGVMHRNTFINSPKLLDCHFRLKSNPKIFFAGQITGVEGYTESAASGIYVGYNLSNEILGKKLLTLPKTTMLGALSHYISDAYNEKFQPITSNMGLLPSLPERVKDKKLRYKTIAENATVAFDSAIDDYKEKL